MTKEQAIVIVDEVFLLYEKFGESDYIGEPVSQIEHMCQAAQLTDIVLSPEPGVTIINGLGGAGMTFSFALTADIIQDARIV